MSEIKRVVIMGAVGLGNPRPPRRGSLAGDQDVVAFGAESTEGAREAGAKTFLD